MGLLKTCLLYEFNLPPPTLARRSQTTHIAAGCFGARMAMAVTAFKFMKANGL